MADMMRLQHDELSVPARNLVPFLREVAIADPRVDAARQMLLEWDFILDKRSVPAAIYVAWEQRVVSEVREMFVPEPVRDLLGVNMKRVIDWLAAPDGRFGADPLAARDGLLVRSLSAAVRALDVRLGRDMTHWQYGQERYKHALIRHPLSAAVDVGTRARLDVGPVPRGGYARTLNNTGGSDNQTSGASFRIIVDTEDWDNSVGTNSPGQSGNPDDPHYRDLFELWARGTYFPVFYSRQKIESVAEETTHLTPASTTSASR